MNSPNEHLNDVCLNGVAATLHTFLITQQASSVHCSQPLTSKWYATMPLMMTSGGDAAMLNTGAKMSGFS